MPSRAPNAEPKKSCASPATDGFPGHSPSPKMRRKRPTGISCPSLTRNKIINRASSTKHFPLRRSNKQKTKAQQQTPKAQLTPTQKYNRARSTNCVPVTTAPTKTAKAQQDASKFQLQQKTAQARREIRKFKARAQKISQKGRSQAKQYSHKPTKKLSLPPLKQKQKNWENQTKNCATKPNKKIKRANSNRHFPCRHRMTHKSPKKNSESRNPTKSCAKKPKGDWRAGDLCSGQAPDYKCTTPIQRRQ